MNTSWKGRQGGVKGTNDNPGSLHLPASPWFDFSEAPAPAKQRGSIRASHRITWYFYGFFLFFNHQFILNTREAVFLWTIRISPVTFFSHRRQLWHIWRLTPSWQQHKEADLRENIGAFNRTPPLSLSLLPPPCYLFLTIYLVVRPPDTVSYSTRQWMRSTSWSAASEVSGAHNVSLRPPVWEWRIGTIVRNKARAHHGVVNIGWHALCAQWSQ